MKCSSTEQRPEFVPRPHTTAGELAGSALMCSQRTGTLERWGNSSNDNHETVVTEDRVSFLRRSCLEGGQKAPETVTVLQPGLAGGEELYLMKGYNDQKKRHYRATVCHQDPLSTKSFSPLPPFTPPAIALVQVLAWGAQTKSEPSATSAHARPLPTPLRTYLSDSRSDHVTPRENPSFLGWPFPFSLKKKV